MRRRTFSLFLVLTLIFCLFSQPVSTHAALNTDANTEFLNSVIELINQSYQGEMTDEELLNGALKGIFNSMDNYSGYFSPEEFEDYINSSEGNFVGVGVTIEKSDEGVKIVGVFKGTPADEAGLKVHDIIVSVDGISTIGMSLEEAGTRIRGVEGTTVSLGVVRGLQPVRIFKIVRAQITINPVYYEILQDGIGYIKLESFNESAAGNFNKALNEMDRSNIKKIVLDLRGNPGGTVDSCVRIAQKLIPKGLITTLDFKSPEKKDESFYSELPSTKYKLAVLVNESSASASEILAGAIQDSKAGVLIGTNTFGKAQVQSFAAIFNPTAFEKYKKMTGEPVIDAYDLMERFNIIPYTSEIIGYAKMTIGVYMTPSGKVIDSEGLVPDFKVVNPEITEETDASLITELSKTKPYVRGAVGEDIFSTERILRLLGYYVDNPDKTFDIVSYRALRFFQLDNGINPDGVLNIATQQALNTKLEQIADNQDLQLTKAIDYLKQ